MSELRELAPVESDPPRVRYMSNHDRLVIRASDDVDTLVRLRAQLRAIKAGRGRWLLWTWLLVLGGGTFTVSNGVAPPEFIFFVLLGAIVIIALVVGYIKRAIKRANYAEDWLSEVDFRLAQLAARESRA